MSYCIPSRVLQLGKRVAPSDEDAAVPAVSTFVKRPKPNSGQDAKTEQSLEVLLTPLERAWSPAKEWLTADTFAAMTVSYNRLLTDEMAQGDVRPLQAAFVYWGLFHDNTPSELRSMRQVVWELFHGTFVLTDRDHRQTFKLMSSVVDFPLSHREQAQALLHAWSTRMIPHAEAQAHVLKLGNMLLMAKKKDGTWLMNDARARIGSMAAKSFWAGICTTRSRNPPSAWGLDHLDIVFVSDCIHESASNMSSYRACMAKAK